MRTSKQPVPYLEAERLMLTALSQGAMSQMLSKEREVVASEEIRKAPLPDWYDDYMRCATEADSATDERATALLAMEALPHEAPPLSTDGKALSDWWAGAHA